MKNINELLYPEKIIEGKTGARIHLKGVDYSLEQWVEAPKYREIKTLDQAELAGFEYYSRMVRACIKKVENVFVRLPSGEEIEFELSFDENGIITLDSFTFLNRLLKDDDVFAKEISKFYQETIDISKYIVKKK